jgi:hypothetical protein
MTDLNITILKSQHEAMFMYVAISSHYCDIIATQMKCVLLNNLLFVVYFWMSVDQTILY